jgi:hypothetical protein
MAERYGTYRVWHPTRCAHACHDDGVTESCEACQHMHKAADKGQRAVPDLPQAALNAAAEAWQDDQGDPGPVALLRIVLEAAAPHIAAAERERLRGILRQDPLIMADPVRIARLLTGQEATGGT